MCPFDDVPVSFSDVIELEGSGKEKADIIQRLIIVERCGESREFETEPLLRRILGIEVSPTYHAWARWVGVAPLELVT